MKTAKDLMDFIGLNVEIPYEEQAENIMQAISNFEKEIRSDTAANVFGYIIDNGEIIPEEQCQRMLYDFLKEQKLG